MMRKCFFAWMAVVLLLCGSCMCAYATESTQVESTCSLTLQYCREGVYYSELEVCTYRVADVFADGSYVISGELEYYPIQTGTIASQTHLHNLAYTLSSYYVAEGYPATYVGITDENGMVTFEDLEPGMYLTLPVQWKSEAEIITFEGILSVVAQLQPDGTEQTTVTAYPESSRHVPTYEPMYYKVVGQWKDSGYTQNRQENINIEIYRNGELFGSGFLRQENNWVYQWEAIDDGALWVVIERTMPSQYSFSLEQKDQTFVITNVYDAQLDMLEHGKMLILWPILAGVCGVGVILIIVGLCLRKRR